MTPYRPLRGLKFYFWIWAQGMWGMYNGVKANEKRDGANEKNLGSSGDPLLTPYRPLIGLNFYFLYESFFTLKLCSGKLPGVAGYFASIL